MATGVLTSVALLYAYRAQHSGPCDDAWGQCLRWQSARAHTRAPLRDCRYREMSLRAGHGFLPVTGFCVALESIA
jgi:hypothetical protein